VSQNNAYIIQIHCISPSYISDSRAWDLLRRILDEKGFVQEHLPYDVVSWITDESRQEISPSVPSKIDEIEQEVNAFRQRMEMDDSEENTNGEVGWTRGWKKWDGEWIPRPIGV
jgi:hypothetical protein